MNLNKNKNILIVDDDPFLQSLYRKALEREGFNILTAVDGLDAIEMLPNLCADLVVLDLMLPKINGLKVLEAIRGDENHKNLPVLILSNAYLPEVAQKAVKSDATSGMLKSECSPQQLVKIIRETLKMGFTAAEKGPAGRGSWFSNLLGNKAENAAQNAAPAKVATAPAQTTASKSPAPGSAALIEVQNELQKSWPTDIAMIREICLKYVKSVGTQEAEEHLKNLYRRLRLLSARATMGECSHISQLSNALEAMLFEHGFNIKRTMSPSVLQTMVQAVDCIEYLFKTGRTSFVPNNRRSRILLVDDDPVCNMANELALKRANFDTVSAVDGVAALALLENNNVFDLILLDINMPVLNGYDVCKKIRNLPAYKEVPVIFVTLNDDFQSRAQSVLSGSNGLITKPISPLELIVKALVYLLRVHDSRDVVKGKTSVAKPETIAATAKTPATAPAGGPPKIEVRVKELQATQTAVEDRVKSLTESLAVETKRREEAERQAAENLKLQKKLENAQIENQKAHEWFQRMLEESKQQALNGDDTDAGKMEGRTRALESVRNFVEEKSRSLKEVLAVQRKRSENAQQQAVEYARRKNELEAALQAIQQAKENLLKELQAAGNGSQRGKLEAALAENQKSQASLLQKIEKTQQAFQTQKQDQDIERSRIESRIKELEAEKAAAEEKVKALTEALAAEKKRSENAEQLAAEVAERRNALEAELTQSNQLQEQLRAEMAEQQRKLDAQVQTHQAELGDFTVRVQELEAAQQALAELKSQHATVAEQVNSLTQSLAAESGRRTTVEQQAVELLARRAELEQELVRRTEMLEQLRAQLAGQQQRFDVQVQTHQVELGNLSTRAEELEATQAALAELKTKHAGVAEQMQTLAESLKMETDRRAAAEQQTAELVARRAELEREVARRAEAQEQLRDQLARQQQQLEAQVETHNVELGNYNLRVKELEAAQTALAELKIQNQGVAGQMQSLNESLKTESERRTMAEQRAAELEARRAELEQEVARRTQAQEQLRAQLAEQQQRLDAQMQTHQAELGNFTVRAQELEAAQAALAELKAQHAGVTEQVQSLTHSLTAESDRRATAEQKAAELAARRTELEQELAQRTQAQEQLGAQLAEQQKRLDAHVQTHQTEVENLSTQLKELKAAKVALAELKAQHAEVTGQVQALTEALESESSRRVTTEQQAAEFAARRAELEQELARQTQVQEQLRAQLAEQQQRQDAQEQTHAVELGKLAESTKELEAARTNVAELQQQIASVNTQVQSLSESLTAESERRTSAERQAVELTARRTELELELAQRTQSQEQLRAQLAEQQQRLDAQVQTHNSEVGNLSARLKEFEAAQAALAALKLQHADATGQVQALTEALTAECGRRESVEKHAAELMARRTELEQEVARRSHTHEQLRAELADQERRLKAQAEVHHVELGNLATRTKELEAAQAALAELQQQIASVNTQVKSLTESLTAESGRRASLEQQAVELTARRTELEAEVGRRSQAQQELSAQLAEQELRMQMIAGELEDFRRRAGADALRQQQMAGEITESEQARAELGNELAAIRELNVSREASIQTLEAELQQRRSEQQRLDTLLQTEISQRRRLDEQLESIQLKLTETSGLLAQKCTAEQALLGRESELQRRLRNQQEEMATTSANLERQEAEIKNSRAKIAEFQSLQSALCGKIQDLTGQVQKLTESLSVESGQRIKADQRVAEMVLRHGELDQELTRRTQAQEQLRAELAEKQSRLNAEVQAHQTGLNHLATRITELEAAQTDLAELKLQHAAVTEQVQTLTGSLASETGRREIFERQVAELLARRTELEQELTQRTRAQDALRVQLEERVQAHNAELGKLVARTQELEIARTALVELNAQHAAVTAEVRQLTESLATECGRRESAEKAWRAREAELQGLLETQEEKLAKSGASLALQELEVKSARKTIEEMQVLQSSLCQKIQELTGQGEANAKLVQELKAKVIRFENAAVEGQKSLAVLRYAILDASRMNARLQRDRLLKERQNVEAMRRLLSSLVQTPLSLAQRGMLAEIQDSLDGLKQSRSGLAGSAFYPVEPPSFREGEFTFSEVTESAFRTVRAAAEAAGVAVQVSASGSTAGSLLGSAENVHQLITLLAVSPLTIETGITALDLRLAIKPKSDRFAEMTLRVALSSANAAHALLSRLNSVTAAAATLQTGSLNEAETGLAAGWQLAQAMGAQAILEVEGGVETCLVLSLPVEMAPQSAPASLGVTYVPALNGNRNGNGDHKSNGNGNGKHNGHHNGNGYHLTESRTGIEG